MDAKLLSSATPLLLLLHLLLLLCMQAWPVVEGLQLEVTGRTTKCIAEEIQSDVLVVGDYKVVSTSEDGLSVTAKVTSPYGKQLHHLENVHSGQFAFTSKESGKYVACFWLQSAHPNVHLNLALDWKTGVGAKDWESIAKKEKLDGMQLELRQLEEAVGSIHKEMLYLRDREAEMRNLNELTNSRVGWFGIMSLLVCLGVAGWQLWHLKTFFERKKLL
ncbi:hypothetical protein BDL97_01G180400 [Sphagnum fallax]|nr:hypothetical protein BDL97_01G180400 [Sphagnum fallax]